MKVFITKYALTGGIQEKDVEDVGSGMVRENERFGTYYHTEGKDWHRTWESAAERAEKMRQDKIASIDKQRKRLQALSFKQPSAAAHPNSNRQ